MEWETVIGLEVHVQLSTKSKLFSGTASQFGAEPNTQANIYDLALPGVLPVLNEEALKHAVKFGLAINASISKTSVFDRKNYFYPDLPKGYQISQLDFPTVGKGSLMINLEDGSEKVIGVTRAHMEEDAGKSLHEDFHGMSGIDLNRAGTPLLEIVSDLPKSFGRGFPYTLIRLMISLVSVFLICQNRYTGVSYINRSNW